MRERAELGEGGCGVKGFSKRVEETTGPKSVEAKKEIQVGAAAITTHRVPELNLLAASTGMAFLSLPAPCSDDGDGPPNALNAMRHPHLQRDVQLCSPPIRADELPASSDAALRAAPTTSPKPTVWPVYYHRAHDTPVTPSMAVPAAPTLSATHVHDAAAGRQLA